MQIQGITEVDLLQQMSCIEDDFYVNSEDESEQDEYDELVLNGSAWVTHIDGSKREVTFDEKSLYYIYEDDGPVTE
jgi:hypothetical protein